MCAVELHSSLLISLLIIVRCALSRRLHLNSRATVMFSLSTTKPPIYRQFILSLLSVMCLLLLWFWSLRESSAVHHSTITMWWRKKQDDGNCIMFFITVYLFAARRDHLVEVSRILRSLLFKKSVAIEKKNLYNEKNLASPHPACNYTQKSEGGETLLSRSV